VQVNTNKVVAPKKANIPPATRGQKLPDWASAKNLFDITQKFGEKVKLGFDENSNDWVVDSHSKWTRVSVDAVSVYKEKKEGDILELMVAANQQKRDGNLPIEYRPIQ
jgi:hypothetical protein